MGVPASAHRRSCARPSSRLPGPPAPSPILLAALLILAVGASAVSSQEIRYLYDDLGRLVGVVDQQGNAAEYVYDAVGNILEIKRFNVDPAANVACLRLDHREKLRPGLSRKTQGWETRD